MSLPNPTVTFAPFDILQATKLTNLMANISALAAGTGFTAGAIPATALANDSITPQKLVPAQVLVGTSGVITPNADASIVVVTALGADATINAPAGTPKEGQGLLFRIKDTGTARALAWATIYTAAGVTIPSTTVAGKKLYVSARYDAVAAKWDILSVGRQA